jgi:hypothetical protein
MIGEIITEISNAINSLKLSETEIKLLSDEECETVYKDCLNHFVKSGDRRWWWEDFKLPYFIFPNYDNPYKHLNELLPTLDEKVWFIVEDAELPIYPVYDAKAAVLKDIISECFAFEYYIIQKNKEWLICETHHNTLIGIGEKLKNKNINILAS